MQSPDCVTPPSRRDALAGLSCGKQRFAALGNRRCLGGRGTIRRKKCGLLAFGCVSTLWLVINHNVARLVTVPREQYRLSGDDQTDISFADAMLSAGEACLHEAAHRLALLSERRVPERIVAEHVGITRHAVRASGIARIVDRLARARLLREDRQRPQTQRERGSQPALGPDDACGIASTELQR